MKKSTFEKFQSFKDRHNLTYTQMVQIMTDYANTSAEHSASFFAMKYNISEHVFYKLRDYTIIFMLVDISVCRRIRNKAFRNQSSKNASGNYSTSLRHYQALIEKRVEYLKSFSTDEIIAISVEYANGIDLYSIAKKRQVSIHTIRRLLAISLANHLVGEKVYNLMKKRSDAYIHSLKYYDGYTAEKLWNLSKKK